MKTIATAPDAIAYLQELKRHGWEDPHFCLLEDAKPVLIKINFGDLSDEFSALIAERRECVA